MTPGADPPLGQTLTREPAELRRLFAGLRDRHDVANLLEVPYMHLIHILYRAPQAYRYRTFLIPKRSGGTRQISAPHPTLATLQAKLNSVLRLVSTPRLSAHGFVQDRSILTNALQHAGKRYVLNLDLEDFFPSIHFGRVRGLFMKGPYDLPEPVATVLAQICCNQGKLPQGAPTSPLISNMICFRLDGQLQRLAAASRCFYSRYADDITFSTTSSRFPQAIAAPDLDSWGNGVRLGAELVRIVESNDFRINYQKVRIQLPNFRQEVTGLVVNESPNVRRRLVRQVRAMLHAWEKYGKDPAESEFISKYDRRSRNPSLNRPSFGRVIRGKVDFIKMVKGARDPVYVRLWNKLHEVDASFAPKALEIEAKGLEELPDEVWAHWFDYYRSSVFLAEVPGKEKLDNGTVFLLTPARLATAAHVVRETMKVYLSENGVSSWKAKPPSIPSAARG